MENRSFYLGVDGGGTKTTAVAFGTDGRFAAGVTGESINYYSIGMDAARANIKKIIAALSESLGSVRFKAAVIGMSALNSRADEAEAEAFAAGIIDAERVIMDSDLYIALQALCVNGECAVVVAGTGSMVIARTEKGETGCAGGWGHLLGDEGSGYKIGLEGIKAAIRASEGGEKTALLAQCLSFFGIEDMHELIDLYYAKGVSRKKTAAFAANVSTCAVQGDGVAAGIMREQARELFQTAMCRIASLGKDAPIGLWGGVFQHSEAFTRDFCALLAGAGYANARLLPFAPEVGAIIACFGESGIKVGPGVLKLLRETYNPRNCRVL